MNPRRSPFALLARAALILLSLSLSALGVAPTTIDVDVLLRIAYSDPDWSTNPAEGRVLLKRVAGSATKLAGTFTDNLGKGLTYPASADFANALAPTLTLNNRFGTFRYVMTSDLSQQSSSSTAVELAPRKFRDAKINSAFASVHEYNTKVYRLGLQFSVGIVSPAAQANGLTLTLLVDSNSYIVPRDPLTGARSTLSIITASGTKVTPITSPGFFGYITPSSFTISGFCATINYKGRFVTLSTIDDATGTFFSGTAVVSGAGTAAAVGRFSAVLLP
jgi:hypothetical protein